jgi:hypothetical protein
MKEFPAFGMMLHFDVSCLLYELVTWWLMKRCTGGVVE